MITVNSISGGKTSAYLDVHYPADISIFSLVRVEDKDCLWMKGKDEKTRQLVSDKINKEFIGTAEMDEIVYTILDLEQFTGREIKWVTGPTFEQVIKSHANYLPNKMTRFCTVEMKLLPIFNYLREFTPVEMRIGYRPNETNRVNDIKDRCDELGFEFQKAVIGKSKNGKRNKWGQIKYRKPVFPLVEDNIQKDTIYSFWEDKPVRFAYKNNCVGCFNRNRLFLSHIQKKEPEKFNWFIKQEEKTGNQFQSEGTYKNILDFWEQKSFFDDDFSDCDSGYCGL